ncbi:MAG: hypothetical protein K0Q94_2145 [Paenibacillus sp.]|nr:hypothetical protein [Paenibacillus sp.]
MIDRVAVSKQLQGGLVVSEHASVHRTTNSQTSSQSQPGMAETESAGIWDGRPMSSAKIMQLQRTMGNRAVQGMLQRMSAGQPTVQRAGGAGPAPVVTPEQQRKAEMDAERDAKVPSLVDTSFHDIRTKVTKDLDTYLTADSKAKPIRENVKAKVISEISASMTQGSAEQKSDALKHAEESAESLATGKLKEYAEEVAQAQYDDTKKPAMVAEANKAYDSVTPSLKDAAFEKQKTKAADEAQKKLNTFAKTAIAEAIKSSKLVIAAKFTPAAPGASSGFDSIDVGTVGVDELEKRINLDGTLVDQVVVRQEEAGGVTSDIKDMENVYNLALFEPLKKVVLSKLGVGRSGFRRSKELNQLREAHKQAARDKLNAKVDDVFADRQSQSPTTVSSPMMAEYQSMMSRVNPNRDAEQLAARKEAAKALAHKEAKKLVNDVMADEADTILERLIPKASTIDALTVVGKSGAYAVARKANALPDDIRAAGIRAATAHAEKMAKDKKEAAELEARKLTKGTKATDTQTAQAPDAAKAAEITEAIKDDTKAGTLAKKVVDTVEAGDLQSGFSKVGKLIDISTPNPGDSSSMDIELKIPFVSASGGGQAYFLFGFGGEAEREADDLTVSTQITFGLGFTTFGFDANFRFGLYLEGEGKDTNQVMNLLSYGLYREILNIAPSAAAFFWGQGGKSGESKLVEAEKWAMMIEEQSMDEDAKVNVGLLTKLAMEANVGVAEFSGELAYKRLSAYNKDIIEKKGKDDQGNVLSAAERVANNSIGKGEIRNIYEAAAEIEVGFGKDKVAFGAEGSMTRIGGKLRELSLGLSASIPSQFGEEGGDFTQYVAKIVTAAVGGGKNISALFQKAIADEPDRKARAGGSVLDTGSDALFTGNYFDSIGASFAEKIMGDETINDTMRSWLPGQEAGASAIEQVGKIALSNSLKLAVTFEREYNEAGVANDWEIGIEASQDKSLEVDAEIVKVAVEKSKRLGKLELSKGKTAKYEFLGFSGGGKETPLAALGNQAAATP